MKTIAIAFSALVLSLIALGAGLFAWEFSLMLERNGSASSLHIGIALGIMLYSISCVWFCTVKRIVLGDVVQV